MTGNVFLDLTPGRSFVLDHFPNMSTKVLMKQHIAHILFAACAVLPQNLPTNWLPVTLCCFCRLSHRDGGDLLDLAFGLAIRGQPGPLASPPAATRALPVVRILGRPPRPRDDSSEIYELCG